MYFEFVWGKICFVHRSPALLRDGDICVFQLKCGFVGVAFTHFAFLEMKSGRNPPHLDGLFSRVSKRHAKCTECGELIVRNQLLRHTQTKHPRLFDEPVGKKGASSPLRQRNNGLAESCCNGASMSIGNGKRSMGHANRNNNNTNSNASPNKYKSLFFNVALNILF